MTSSAVDIRLVETVSAPTNIAVVKYWGKSSVELNTPLNSSVSLTLDQADLRAVTTVAACKSFPSDTLWLNGRKEDVSTSKRFKSCLSLVRRLARDRVDPETGKVVVKKEDWCPYRVRVVSMNTFPTAAGLASSAAGYAALVYALAQLFNAEESYPGELSAIARQGSGSACRSLYGGLVRWNKGTAADGSDSIAIQVASEAHWPELRALIVVTCAAQKETPSTAGMVRSAQTSDLLRYRAEAIVPGRVAALEAAFRDKDFATFAELTMRDSNQFHATCLDTYPPIMYLTHTSMRVIQLVHDVNAHVGRCVAAYTFDAGPNAVIFTTEEYVPLVLGVITSALPPPSPAHTHVYTHDAGLYDDARAAVESGGEGLRAMIGEPRTGEVEMVYHTRIGGGPMKLAASEALIDLQSGMPRSENAHADN